MPTTPSPRLRSASEQWVPTNPAAPVTSTDIPGSRPRRPPRRGGRADLALPVQPTPRGREVLGGGVDERLEAEVRRRHGDEEQRPQEHGARGREAPVQLAVHRRRPLDLHLPRRGREEVVLQHPHLLRRRRRRRRALSCNPQQHAQESLVLVLVLVLFLSTSTQPYATRSTNKDKIPVPFVSNHDGIAPIPHSSTRRTNRPIDGLENFIREGKRGGPEGGQGLDVRACLRKGRRRGRGRV
uniref:Uncharacterized protein n=1 Tax=Oryza brachyantha TaxID=4533 RepID=J3LHW7_ORYBR